MNVSKDELCEIKRLHESILSKSSHGLFHSMGKIIGKKIIEEIQDRNRFFEEATRILKERGIIEDASFKEKKIIMKGSIEAVNGEVSNCDLLRGIIVSLYVEYYQKKVYCKEIQCESRGAQKCIFEIKEDIF